MTLKNLIETAELYRQLWPAGSEKTPDALVFSRRNADAATQWFTDKFGAQPIMYASSHPVPGASGEFVPLKACEKLAAQTVVMYGDDTRKLSIQLSLSGVRFVYFSDDPKYRHVKDDADYYRNHESQLDKLYHLLGNEESRQTLSSVVKHRITGDHGYLRMAQYAEYEHPAVSATRGDWVLDCGASNGNTSFRFAEQVGPAGVVFAFEPDPSNAEKIRKRIEQQPQDAGRVVLVNAAVSDRNGSIRFTSNKGGASKLSMDGDVSVDVLALDDFIRTQGFSGRGLISFDVEGYEMQALTGGLSCLKALRPKLQVSIYHRPKDLFEIPLWISEELENYTLYMGHHDSYHCETDIYAIPNELK
ncbi:FkbM family methyltransferase [Xanthobacteraceae bacterium A53D]